MSSRLSRVYVRDQVQAGASAADQKVGEAKKLFEIDLCVSRRERECDDIRLNKE